MARLLPFVYILILFVFSAALVGGREGISQNISKRLGLTPSCVDRVVATCGHPQFGPPVSSPRSLYPDKNGCAVEMKSLLESLKDTAEKMAIQENSLLEIKSLINGIKESNTEQQTLLHYLKQWVETIVVQEKSLTEIKSDLQFLKDIKSELQFLKEIEDNFQSLNEIKNDFQIMKEIKKDLQLLKEIKIDLQSYKEIKDEFTFLREEIKNFNLKEAHVNIIEKLKEDMLLQKNSLLEIKDTVEAIDGQISSLSDKQTQLVNQTSLPQNCADLLKFGNKESGIRTVYPYKDSTNQSVSVVCDQATDGGGWTVFQRRKVLPQRENFFRTWKEYQIGFGNLSGEFWLGLDNIHALVNGTQMELRVELEDFEGNKRWAKYDNFSIEDAGGKYRLHVEGYSGNAGDSLANQNGCMFSTKDNDNDKLKDKSCAIMFRGAWWYEDCHRSNLNGYQYEGKHTTLGDGINWFYFRGDFYSMKETAMKLRPKV